MTAGYEYKPEKHHIDLKDCQLAHAGHVGKLGLGCFRLDGYMILVGSEESGEKEVSFTQNQGC